MKVDHLVYLLIFCFVLLPILTMVEMNKEVTSPYMDEIFHFPMTVNYFNGYLYEQFSNTVGNLTYWDPKITTFPGLYIVGAVYCKLISLFSISGTFVCSLSMLRWLNIVFLFMTSISVYLIIHYLHPSNKQVKSFLWTVLIMSIPTIIDPYFLFYTDGISLYFASTSILFSILSDRGMRYGYILFSALFSTCAVLCRQTNIILAVLNPALILMLRYGLVRRNEKYSGLGTQIVHFLSLFVTELTFILQLAIPYLVLFIAFLVFFVKNGFSVVLGDRANHTMSIHFMQICYFSVYFCIVFIDDVVFKCYQVMKNPKAAFTTWNCICYLICLVMSAIFVCKFTIIHPFILADNRHFIFYIFKDIVIPFKYLLIPVYATAMMCMCKVLSSSLSAFYILITGILFGCILITSPLVELRYYSFPLLFWICSIQPKTHPILSLSISLTLNLVTWYLFFFRPFVWPDGSTARFMWFYVCYKSSVID